MLTSRVEELSCEEVLINLWTYVKDKLAPDKTEAMNEHLDTCKECRNALKSHREDGG